MDNNGQNLNPITLPILGGNGDPKITTKYSIKMQHDVILKWANVNTSCKPANESIGNNHFEIFNTLHNYNSRCLIVILDSAYHLG